MGKEISPLMATHKSYKIKVVKDDKGNYLAGYKVTSDSNIGIVFPLERDQAKVVDGVRNIFGYDYARKVFNYYQPKKFSVKDKVFSKKTTKFKDDRVHAIPEALDSLRTKKIVTRISGKKNTIIDYTRFINSIIPAYDEGAKWRSPLVMDNIEELLIEILSVEVTDQEGSDEFDAFEVSDNGKCLIPASNLFEKLILGFNIDDVNLEFIRYVDPSIPIARAKIYDNPKLYFIIMILRSIVAGSIRFTEDPVLNRIYHNIKEYSLVFYNDRGVSFIYNTQNDRELKKYKESTTLIAVIKNLLRPIINSNITDNLLPKDDTDDSKVKDAPITKDDENDRIETELLKEYTAVNVDSDIDDAEIIDDGVDDDDADELGSGEEDIAAAIQQVHKVIQPSLTKAQKNRVENSKTMFKTIDLDGRTVEEILKDTAAKTIRKTTSNVKVKDTSLESSSLIDFERSYVKNTLEYDIVNMFNAFRADDVTNKLYMTKLTKEDTSDRTIDRYTYTATYVDDKATPHTIRVNIPKIDENGFLFLGGNRKVLKKQNSQLPIIKVKPDRVMISSQYNKVFLFRQGKVLDKKLAFIRKILSQDFISSNNKINVYFGDNGNSNKEFVTNIEYDTMANVYHAIDIFKGRSKVMSFRFSQVELMEIIESKEFKYTKDVTKLPIGINYVTKRIISVDLDGKSGALSSAIMDAFDEYDVVSDLHNRYAAVKAPKRRMYSSITVINASIPTISFLGIIFGLKAIMDEYKDFIQLSDVALKGDDRVFIKFKDQYLYYDDSNIAMALLLNGLNYLAPEEFDLESFNTVEPYSEHLYTKTGSRGMIKGITSFGELFLDPITIEILRDYKLPTVFLEVFLYSNNLLATNNSTVEVSRENYRIRGYEVIPALMYRSIAFQYRQFKQSNIPGKSMVYNKDAVMIDLQNSGILENYDATNPMNELKTKSIVTDKGPGGINDNRSFSLAKRSYDKTAIGTIALSTTDGAGVGINKQLTINPPLTSTRGYTKPCMSDKEALGKNFSELASPEESDVAFAVGNDDPKRTSFVSGQTKHIIKVEQADKQVISTGFDRTSAYLVGTDYIHRSKQGGTVTHIDTKDKSITIQYNDGSLGHFDLKDKIVRNSSFFFNNEFDFNVKVGDVVKANDILAYDNEFYTKDVSGTIVATQGVLARVAIHEGDYTDDDSSAISSALSKRMTTKVVKRKQITLSKYANLVSWSKVGDHVTKGDPILTFEDSGDEDVNTMIALLGDVSDGVLAMTKQTPKAPMTGKVTGINIYYTRPLEEYSDSIRTFLEAYFKTVKSKIRKAKALQVPYGDLELLLKPTRAVRDRINGAVLEPEGGLLIEYMVIHGNTMGEGDKVTFNANVKSVVAHVFPEDKTPKTQDGEPIDVVMGSFSIAARMIHSIYMSGALGNAIVDRSKQIAREYLK